MAKSTASSLPSSVISPDAVTTLPSVTLSALDAIRGIMGKDKAARHAAILHHACTIGALYICNAPPKGHGNPADHKALESVFSAAGAAKYACAAAALSRALKGKGRSEPLWADAMEVALLLVSQCFAPCAPAAPRSAEAVAASAEKRAASKATKEAEAKKADAAARAADRESLQKALRAATEARAIADNIKAGAYDAQGLQLIADALAHVAGAARPAHVDNVVDVQAREVVAIGA